MVWETTLEVARVRFRVNLLGAVAFAAYAALTLLSFVQAPALWSRHPGAPQAMAFFESLAERFPPLSLMRLLSTNTAVIVSYFVPLSLATLATLALVLMLARRRGALDATVAALLLRWSYAFAAVSLFAFPIFTQDFWLSAVWGRMVAQGLNPYHQLFTPELIAGLPLDHFPMLMSYGPAWALLSGAVMLIAGRDLLIIAILFKAILGAAWIAALILVDKIMVARPPVERCIAIVLIGWLPIGVLQTVAEGHNDIIMAVGALLWMHLLLRGRATAPVALVLSALAKYVTAPLLALDAIWAWRVQRLSWRAFVLRYVAPGLVGLAVLAVFYRSPQFFEGTRVISEWHFLQPRHALYAFDNWIPAALLYPLELVITAAFALMTAYYLVAFWRQADADHLAKAALAIMTTISFAGVAHLWPWYMVWTLGFAALVPTWWLSRYVIGVAILVPFTFAFWWIDSLFDGREWGALALYAGAALWVLVTRPATATTASDAQNRDPAAQAIEAR